MSQGERASCATVPGGQNNYPAQNNSKSGNINKKVRSTKKRRGELLPRQDKIVIVNVNSQCIYFLIVHFCKGYGVVAQVVSRLAHNYQAY